MIEEQLNPVKLRPDIELVAKINKEYTLKNRIRKQPGQILFGVKIIGEFENWECIRIKIKSDVAIALLGSIGETKVNLDYTSNPLLEMTLPKSKVVKNHKAQFDPELVYIYVINEMNALKKVKRDLILFIEKSIKTK